MSTQPTIDTRFVEAAIRKALLSEEEGTAILVEAERTQRPASDVMVEKGLITERTKAVISRAVVDDPSGPTVLEPSGQFGSESKTNVEVDEATGPTRIADVAFSAEETGAAMPKRLGKFEVLDMLGQGGMGAVFRGRDEGLGRMVALKVLSPNYASDRSAADRFLREARLSAQINHPNVITVHAVGEEEGRLYMALEYLEGGDATSLLEKHPDGIPEQRALEIVRDCARGLVAIERAGLLHRDIKPSNIFITAEGDAKLADLGLARTQAGDDRMTQTGAVVGTPCYMAPEQARGASDLDIRTDVYALAASLFRLVTGVVPFTGSSAFVVISNVLNEPAPSPREWRPDLSDATCDLIARAMAKDPDARFDDAKAFLEAVEAALASAPSASEPRAISGVRIGVRDRLHSQRPGSERTAATASGRQIRPPSGRSRTRPDGPARTTWSGPGAPPSQPQAPHVVLRTPAPEPSSTPILPVLLGAGALVIAVAAFARQGGTPEPSPSQVASAIPTPTSAATPPPTTSPGKRPTTRPSPTRTPPPPPPPRKTDRPPSPPDRRPPKQPPPPPVRGRHDAFASAPLHRLPVQVHPSGQGVEVGYRHEFVGVFPRDVPWGKVAFTDSRAAGRELPLNEDGFQGIKYLWTLRADAEVNAKTAPAWLEARGFPGSVRPGFYAHLGVRANNHALSDVKRIGKAVWITLLFERRDEELIVHGLVRVSPRANNSDLNLRPGGVQSVGSFQFAHDPREELNVTLYVNRGQWLVQIGTGNKVTRPIGGLFADGGMRRGFPRRAFQFLELGNFSDGRGFGSVRSRTTTGLTLNLEGNQVRESRTPKQEPKPEPRSEDPRLGPDGRPLPPHPPGHRPPHPPRGPGGRPPPRR